MGGLVSSGNVRNTASRVEDGSNECKIIEEGRELYTLRRFQGKENATQA